MLVHTEESLFHAARVLPSASEQLAFLEEACGEDRQLLARVQRLLEFHGYDESLEATNASLGDTARIATLPTETQIGPYTLLEQIGEGGFGYVYVAEQTQPVKRQVALKILKPGMDSRQIVARFEAERQALALMDHPHIARIIDGGTTAQGRPYSVMELVHGLPITQFCDEHRLTIRQRLELFVQVCQAVQHAHQKGIIHRDIKPSNVLVASHDETPVPKVIDFGVAKAMNQTLTDKTIYTQFAQLIGTPLYMSPEQAQLSGLDVDTRSDVYSLGVLLYELLTGTTPFEIEVVREKGLDELRRMIREEEPAQPSKRISTLNADAGSTISEKRSVDPRKLKRHLSGELDWIVMRALEKSRSRRYQSAADLAEEVERYLTNRPVEASPPSTLYRVRKYVRRHRGLLATITVVIAALLTGTGVSLWQAYEAGQARKLANERYHQAEKERKRAEESYETARDTINRLLHEAANKEVVTTPGMEKMYQNLLQEAVNSYSALIAKNPDDPKLYKERAEVQYSRADKRAAIEDLEQACLLDPTDHAAHGRIAQLTVENSDVSRAERDLTHVDTAIALAPRVSRYRLYRLVLLRLLGRNGEMKQEMEAIASFESLSADEYRTLSIMHRSLRDNVSALHFAQLSVNAGPDGSIYHWELGEALSACGRHREAIEAVSTAIELEPQVSSSRPSVVDPILLRAEAYLYECEYDKALVDFETFRRKTVGTGRHRDRLWPGLGQALLNSGKCSETVVLLNEMQEEDPLTFASLCLNLAKHRRFPEELGIDLMLEWEQRRGNPPRPSSLSDILLGLALYLHSIHEGAPNERLLEECVSLSEAYVANPPSSRAHDAELGYAWHCVGQVAEKAAKLAVARVAFQHSVAVYESLTLGDSASAYSHYIAAIAALAAKDQTGYQRICRRMLERFRESKEADALDWTCWTLAIAPGALDRSQHGVELAKRAVTYVSSEDAVRNLGALYFRSGEYLSAQRELTAISSAESQRSAPAYAWYFLAMTEQQLGNRSAALEWFDKATQYREDVLCEAVGNPVLLSWNRELTLDVLHTEADALLRSTASPAK